jgi:hypothetical protein
VTTTSAPTIASGSVRRGSRTSSPAVETASRPMKEKKIDDAATLTPATPIGANGVKLPASKAVNATATKNSSTAILTTTIVTFARADSRTPPMSSTAQSVTSTMAGRFTAPPAPGAADSASGSRTPIVSSSSWLTYSLHPTLTAAALTPYSRARHQPTA